MNIDNLINEEEEVQQEPQHVEIDSATRQASAEVEFFLSESSRMVKEYNLQDIADSEFYTRMLTIMQSQHQVHKSIEMTRKAQLGI